MIGRVMSAPVRESGAVLSFQFAFNAIFFFPPLAQTTILCVSPVHELNNVKPRFFVGPEVCAARAILKHASNTFFKIPSDISPEISGCLNNLGFSLRQILRT